MTLRSRNIIVVLVFLALCLALLAYVLLLMNLDLQASGLAEALAVGKVYYLNNVWALSDWTPYVNIISPGASLVLAWLAAFVFLRYFRKISSPQLFFLALFWFSMSTELVRVLNLWLLAQDVGLGDRQILAKLAMSGRLVGSLALFAASLYSAGIRIQRQETVLGAIVLVSVSLAWMIPLDIDRVGQELLLMPAAGFSLDMFRLLTGALTIVNFVKYAITTRDTREYFLVFPIVLLVLGQELLFLAMDWLGLGLSWICLTLGSFWVARRFINDYLWY